MEVIMKRIIALVLSLVITMSLVISGCGAKNQQSSGDTEKESPKSGTMTEEKKSETPEKVTLRVAWWGNQERHDMTLKVMDMYKEKSAHVSFEAEYNDWTGYWDKLATQAAANSLPDIIQQDYAYLGQWSDKGLLEDLEPYTESGVLDVSDIGDSFLSGGRINGKLYGISLGTNALSMVYDPEVFEKAGVPAPSPEWTWKDFEQNLTKVYEKTKIQTHIPLLKDPKFLLEYFVREKGKSIFNKDGSALGFDDKKIVVDMLEMVLRMVKSGVFINPETEVLAKTTEDDWLVQGKATSGIYWSNFVVPMSDLAKKEFGVTLLPKSPDAVRPGLYLKPSMFFAITKSSENKEEAAKFVSYFVNDVEANKVLMANRGVPVPAKVREALKTEVAPAVRQTFDYISLAGNNSSPIDPPEPQGAAEVTQLFKTLFEEVVFQKTTPEDAASRFMKEANDILAKNAKK